ncbi:hypothetical protein L484_019989 [Morus notabilis]|uniref:PGG domain-containing protein n=1 Tax=Morus notabilis TaxID=981085 RepID=W9R588_9ROSA|nr:hypothetical protein L484_019989 [Morus notabilis]
MVEKILEEFPVAIQDMDSNRKNVVLLAVENRQLHAKKIIPKESVFSQVDDQDQKFVKSSMPQNFFAFYNEKKETPKAIFIDSHEKLIKEGTEWLSKTSKSCSVVAALVATVAFTTSSAFPSEVKEEKGTPMLEDEPTFNTFAIASSMLSASDQ